jgi:hypothetical protein
MTLQEAIDRLKLFGYYMDETPGGAIEVIVKAYEQQKSSELNILRNFIQKMSKVYRHCNQNWVIVRDLLMSGTNTGGMTSCIEKCRELGIDPYGYILEVDDEA